MIFEMKKIIFVSIYCKQRERQNTAAITTTGLQRVILHVLISFGHTQNGGVLHLLSYAILCQISWFHLSIIPDCNRFLFSHYLAVIIATRTNPDKTTWVSPSYRLFKTMRQAVVKLIASSA